jgi:hypothetical protein
MQSDVAMKKKIVLALIPIGIFVLLVLWGKNRYFYTEKSRDDSKIVLQLHDAKRLEESNGKVSESNGYLVESEGQKAPHEALIPFRDKVLESKLSSELLASHILTQDEYDGFVNICRDRTSDLVKFEEKQASVTINSGKVIAMIAAYPEFGKGLKESIEADAVKLVGNERAKIVMEKTSDILNEKFSYFGQYEKEIQIISTSSGNLKVYRTLLFPLTTDVKPSMQESTGMSTMSRDLMNTCEISYLAPYVEKISGRK